MARPDTDALFAALSLLKDGASQKIVLSRAAQAGAWRTIDAFLKARFPHPKDEDARQSALLSIHRSAGTMEAKDATSAAAWVRTIVERKRIDRARSERSRRALSLVGADGEDVAIESTASVTLSDAHVTGFFSEVEAAIDQVVERDHARPQDRLMPRLHARARLYRSLGHGVAEIRELLGLTEPVSDAALSKWIERGLAPLSEAIELWRAEAPSRSEVAAHLLERVEMRRVDAGKARLSRRKSGDDGDASVRSPGGRRTSRRRCVMSLSQFTRSRFHPRFGAVFPGKGGTSRSRGGSLRVSRGKKRSR